MTDTRADARLAALYQEMILDHYRRPRNKGALPAATGRSKLSNPICGDEIEVQVEVRDDRIVDVRFAGRGCSISQASASMMTELVKGRTPGEALGLAEQFAAMLRGGNDVEPDASLGAARALSGVARFPTRVPCAWMAWDALARATARP